MEIMHIDPCNKHVHFTVIDRNVHLRRIYFFPNVYQITMVYSYIHGIAFATRFKKNLYVLLIIFRLFILHLVQELKSHSS
jgi:hypothetical protein